MVQSSFRIHFRLAQKKRKRALIDFLPHCFGFSYANPSFFSSSLFVAIAGTEAHEHPRRRLWPAVPRSRGEDRVRARPPEPDNICKKTHRVLRKFLESGHAKLATPGVGRANGWQWNLSSFAKRRALPLTFTPSHLRCFESPPFRNGFNKKTSHYKYTHSCLGFIWNHRRLQAIRLWQFFK